ncbi:uncharacterized protein LOC115753558 isoform X2 [Rhodamnia argentea]|uniref:Uncharacterized protein LOC115753558 isoform X2 n=1 Tax=Rhodamnia argentea TaxID=178133 RepID=A0A8B8QNL7_9MYRT|nr:uncharacterized protein LOC115753558 isoform X2 [Rhodamnia argentea]
MRIRKNAKLSSVLRSQAAPPEAPLPSHVCLLNQSPWDVLPFSFPDALPPSSSSLPQQLDGGEDSFTANGSSFCDSLGAVDSVASMMAVDAVDETIIVSKLGGRAYDRMNIEDRTNISSYEAQNGGDFDGDFSFKVCCNKTDGKRWQCKKDAVDGHYLCQHHLSQLKSYITTAAADEEEEEDDSNAAYAGDSASRKLDKSSASTGRRGRPRGAKKNSSSSAAVAAAAAASSNQFYYYSGFGPSWGKRRSSGRAGDQPRRPEGRAGGSPQPTPPRIGGEGIDYVDYHMDDDDEEVEEEEDDDDDDGGDSGKKRMRKPVKARSLKSLM